MLCGENFRNVPDTGLATRLADYVSDPDGLAYSSKAPWDDPAQCNGFVSSNGNTLNPAWCNSRPSEQTEGAVLVPR
ncbi:hypothetical protein BN381_350068 [Candidatus Microthrix parvicella RN1]|uniref:Uncharacterized protein n=1 Tax=Candidatus Neomicrothrix parvicella RN1 TaxID=1229780 RepID=R4Z0G1_9ACTN|nr:hypothetical protein BN381_350068 [Candidatus Microthrix parvicella RN1]